MLKLFETPAVRLPALFLAVLSSGAADSEGQTLVPAAGHAHATFLAVRTSKPPVIDGRLDDEAWLPVVAASSFSQQDPDEGQPATERTEIRVLYDDDAVYVAARLFDSRPDLISRRLSKRDDDADADRFTVYLDPMLDHLTGVSFRVTASGVQKDAAISNDTFEDATWDAVWQSAVSIDATGWSVEIRVPLSQLRFARAARATWGFNAARFIRRKNETDWLERVPKRESGLASRMAHVDGLDGIAGRPHMQILPYAAARGEFIAPPDGNPFNSGARLFDTGGLDFKWSLTSKVTLDASVNPDFGQVEVDPAVVNLSAFETFFEERRPFFLEGSQIFGNFGRNGANSGWGFNTSDPIVFYSRRIGRAPQLQASGDFVDPPSATTILAATKLTGRTANGWTIGLVDAVTDRETARMASGGVSGVFDVEPMTNYFVARLHRDVGRRAGLGLLATSVTRRLDTQAFADTLAQSATVAGGDGYWFLGPARNWVVNGRLVVSHIAGSAAAITRSQQASARYFQRPDAPEVELDRTRTSLSGYTGRANLNRNSGLWLVNASLWGVSPGFESNDLGFLGTSDRAGGHIVLQRRSVTQDRFSRSRNWWIAKWWTWNFARELQGDGIQGQTSATFLNYWSANGGGQWRRRVLDDRLTRGGPSATSPAGGNWNLNMATDPRRMFSINAFVNGGWNESGAWNRNVGATLTFKPSPMLTMSIGPQLNRSWTTAQYIQTVVDSTAVATYGERDVFGGLDQTQVSMTTRVNAVLSSRLSLQIFAQPLLASGAYREFKELARPRTFDFLTYGTSASSLAFDPAAGTVVVDADGTGPSPSFAFDNPDFNFKSLRVNAVFRWELKPGSAFYAVWTRQQVDESHPGEFALGRDMGALWSARGNDVVLVKVAYWIGR